MAKNLERYDKLVIVGLIITALVLGIGYLFAQRKSEPVYLSKIDRLMFDKDNKAPALLLTLPDNLDTVTKSEDDTDLDFEKPQPQPSPKVETAEFSLESLINGIPSLSKLPSRTYPVSLKAIDLIPELTETSEDGLLLPKNSIDGHHPWSEYGQTTPTQPNFKKIAIVIANLGFDGAAIAKIASAFAPEVSLSFQPYLTHAAADISAARQKGHETYVDIPLASADFLREDTGPLALNFSLDNDDLRQRFHRIIAQPAPIGGVIIRSGAITGSDIAKLTPILEEIRDRGLLMIDATGSDVLSSLKISSLPRRKADIIIHRDMLPAEIDEQIKKAENIAFDKGQILIVADDKPLGILALHRWIETFSPQLSYEEAKTVDIIKPFALVPLSNLVVE
ncbi:MAG: divergent polysaccharide deacetylase family protein [Alphaproteobacteria bacterium]|nr:divergent polysaccharide deacetylase family protein [Alphaproteobacteria bacterium]MBQ9236169.1 divergent polysaccharide deacetylase family protein [Alphaproteobacteria bacterium]